MQYGKSVLWTRWRRGVPGLSSKWCLVMGRDMVGKAGNGMEEFVN